MEFSKNNNIEWTDNDPFQEQSTSIPEVLDDTTQIGTLIIFVISAILTITFLFGIAIFIDCRQQKLTQLEAWRKRRVVRLKIPRIGRQIRDDEDTIVDKIHEPSASNVIV